MCRNSRDALLAIVFFKVLRSAVLSSEYWDIHKYRRVKPASNGLESVGQSCTHVSTGASE